MSVYPDVPSFSVLPVLLAHCLVTLRTAASLPVPPRPGRFLHPIASVCLRASKYASPYPFHFQCFQAFARLLFCCGQPLLYFFAPPARIAGTGESRRTFAAKHYFQGTRYGLHPILIALLLPAPGRTFSSPEKFIVPCKKIYYTLINYHNCRGFSRGRQIFCAPLILL